MDKNTKYIMALDQGTTSSRAILFDKQQNIISIAQREISQIYPKEGWVEHDAMEIYATQYAVMMEALARADVLAGEVAAIGVTNQRETTVVWDKVTGLPIHNAIVWQCRRTADIVDDIVKSGLGEYIRKTTGLVPDAYFSASKIKWLLDNIPNARERAERGELLFGTIESWLIWKLTNGAAHITDFTNASRTMLFNIHTLEWDKRLIDAFGVPKQILPKVVSNSEIYGYANIQGINVPISGAAGDQQAALFGQCCFEAGDAKNTYGTGCFLLMNTGGKPCVSSNGLITTIATNIGGKINYALEGSVFVGGAVIQWLRDELRFFTDSPDSEYFASKVKDTGGVYFVPAFTGLGAPYWDMRARGCIMGLTRGTRQEHITRAAQESIAYQCYDLVCAIERDTDIKLKELKADGGASGNAFLMQFQADVLDKPVIRPVVRETTALGAAYLAGLAVGFWNGLDELKAMWQCGAAFAPSMGREEREAALRGWAKAIGRSLDWVD